MLNHRHKRILFPVLFVKEMTLICPEAPSGCQNPQEFPKGIKANLDLLRAAGKKQIWIGIKIKIKPTFRTSGV